MTAEKPTQERAMLITGANGFIGSRLAALALERGYKVKTLTRSDWDYEPPVPMVQRYYGSFPEQIPPQCLEGVDVVVHCAARVEEGFKASYAVNVEGTVRLAKMARAAGVKNFIFPSSQSAKPDALSDYGKTKYLAEQALLEQEGLRVAVLRLGLVVGDGKRGLYRRLCKIVESSPVIPLLGGGVSVIQPIHVDDVCEAVFKSDAKSHEIDKKILRLASPEGLPLKEFLKKIASEAGLKRFFVPVPLELAEFAVYAAKKIGIPVSINSNNLKGLKVIEKMETAKDLALLGIQLRTLEAMLSRNGHEVNRKNISLKNRAVRVILIGAGRIGMVHAITLSRLHGVILCGIVDSKPGATAFLRDMGVNAPSFKDLDSAVNQTRPDAAVIATPASSHLSLVRICLKKNLAVLVEKPLAVNSQQLSEFALLNKELPQCLVQIGYVMLRNTHVDSCLEQLRLGNFGKVKGFTGITLLSFFNKTNNKRWEVHKEISGGGSYINSGGHVLSMIYAAFGRPQSIEAQTLKIYSEGVEDSAVASFAYPDFSGKHYCSWSIEGYPRQENMLKIYTDRGQLQITASMGAFIDNNGSMRIIHQLDSDIGFNLSPDYAGSGFTAELTDLKKSAQESKPAPVDLRKTIALEEVLMDVYKEAREVHVFEHDGRQEPPHSLPENIKLASGKDYPGAPVRLILDLRSINPQSASGVMGEKKGAKWDGYLLFPSQLKQASSKMPDEQTRITVPDFFNQSRLLAAGEYGQVLGQMGLKGAGAAMRAAIPLLAKERALTFWVAAMGLLGAGLSEIPSDFHGTLLLQNFLTDFALALGRLDILEKMLSACRKACPQARIGFHTCLASDALNALHLLDAPVDEVAALASPGAGVTANMFAAMREAVKKQNFSVVAEVGLAPAIVHKAASQNPQRWSFGAEAVIVHCDADDALSGIHLEKMQNNWQKAFPGTGLYHE